MLCGLEIHQRLAGKKLFNACPTSKPDEQLAPGSAHITRTLRAVQSEMGGLDVAAKFEGAKIRKFEYVAPQNFCCLVDVDEEPPNGLNLQALLAAARFANSIGAKLVDEIHFMRKAIIDGSNTSGFQRTALIAIGGKISSGEMEIPIQTICLEEESAGIIPPIEGRTAYRLDRLGIPLIEIATDPVFTTPMQAYEGAQAIGLALRGLPEVMRGLGTIRQDVNVSIPGGARVEIKGLQDLKILPALIENEVKRQEGLIEIAKEMEKRKAGGRRGGGENKFFWVDASELVMSSKCKVVVRALAQKGVVLAAKLENMAGILGKELYAGRRFGTELSDYAKMAGGVHGLIHSDEDLLKYGFEEEELDDIKTALDVRAHDAFVIIAGDKQKAEMAIIAAIERSGMLKVPSETRKAEENGASSFMRPLGGSHRMYPETDVRPIRITKELLKLAGKKIEGADERRERLIGLLGAELGEQMLRSTKLQLFEELRRAGAEPKLAAVMLEQTLTSLRREGLDVEKIPKQAMQDLLALHKKGKITKAAILEILRAIANEEAGDVQKIIAGKNLERISGRKLEQLYAQEGADMRSFMAKYRLVVEGSEIAGLAKKK